MRIRKRTFTAKSLVEKIEEGPVRFLVPGVVVAALVVSVVNGYTPLEFQAPAAKASTASENLDKKVDASKLEKKKPSKKLSAKSTVSSDALVDGTYTGYSRCKEDGVFDYWLALDVTVKGGEVTGISNVRGSGTGKSGSTDLGTYDTRNAKYLDWAVKGRGSQEGVVNQLMDSAASGSVAGSIDTVSGATYSSESILEAYQDALSQASASGTTPATPKAGTRHAVSAGSTQKRVAVKKAAGIGAGTKLADGTWRGYDRCTEEDTFDYYVAVDVTVKGGRVTRLSNIHGSGTGNKGSKNLGTYDTVNDTYLGWAVNGRNAQKGVARQIAVSMAKGKIATSIDTVSGATYSSRSILNAYLDALQKSAKAAGTSSVVPSGKNTGSKDSGGTGDNKGGTPDNGGSSGGSGTDDAAKKNPNSGFSDGTYTGYGFAGTTTGSMEFAPYYVGVTISVADGKIVDLTNDSVAGDADGTHDPAYRYDAGENAYYFKRALNGYGISGKHPGLVKQINTGLEAGAALVPYDTISGATYTSDAIIEAYTAAVALAKPQPGADDGHGSAGESGEGGAEDAGSGSAGTGQGAETLPGQDVSAGIPAQTAGE